MMKNEHSDKYRKLLAAIKFTSLILLIIGIPAYMYFFQYEFISGFRSVDDIEAYIDKYEIAGAFVYIGLQIVQVIISIIPAQPFNLAAGYIYAFLLGYALSITGTALGTSATFFLARMLGKDAIYLLFGEKKITKFVNQMNSKRALMIIFILYLVPGIPKDPIGYAVGLSKVKFLPFLGLSLVGRTPAMMMTIMVGSMLNKNNYTGVIILSVIVVTICILTIVYRKRIMTKIDKRFENMVGSE